MMKSSDGVGRAIIVGFLVVAVLTLFFTLSYKITYSYIINSDLNVSVTPSDNPIFVELAEKKEIHEGNFYFIRNYDIVASGTNLGFLFNVTDKEIHIIISVLNEYNANYTLIENATIISSGTKLDYFNRNRLYTDASSIEIYKNPQFSGGLHIASNSFGDGGWRWSTGGGDSDVNELVLAPHTTYILYIENLYSGNNIFNYVFDWSEQ